MRDKLLGRESHDIDIAVDDMTGAEFGAKVAEYQKSQVRLAIPSVVALAAAAAAARAACVRALSSATAASARSVWASLSCTRKHTRNIISLRAVSQFWSHAAASVLPHLRNNLNACRTYQRQALESYAPTPIRAST